MEHRIRKPNRLVREKSPYLLQHAENPVNWYPWCEEAFQKAQQRDVPVFLSIGYSTCHWCHVMAHESFEDEEVAEILNRGFVCVKVDREERPDIDSVYMAACQALTGSGGWPLTILMTPDKKPFFAGTYFPKKEKFGSLGLIEILTFIEKNWKVKKQQLIEESQRVIRFLEETGQREESEEMAPDALLEGGRAYFKKSFDAKRGGFGPSPKFPSPHNLLFLLEQDDRECMDMAEKTLLQMYRGGIFDHIGGGFCRYSTDEAWLVPHFEKMLYDNALLLLAYGRAFRQTGKELYRYAADRIAAYVFRELTHEEGGFYCSQDADSDGEEGKYYVFSPGEIKEALGDEKGEAFCGRFDIGGSGNFQGKSIPNLLKTEDYETREAPDSLERLVRYRKKRTRLHRDDKILTGWNGLMISALAKTSAQLDRPEFLQGALRAEAFVWDHLRQDDGSLLTRWRQGEAAFRGTLEDHAFLAWAELECYEATFQVQYLERAALVGSQMLDQFFDWKRGGCFLYGKDSEKLFTRPKELYDGAMPSGNSAAALVMKRLAFFTGTSRWREAWERQKRFLLRSVRHPAGHSFFLWVLTEEERDRGQLICTAKKGVSAEELRALDLEVLVKTEENQKAIETVAPFLKDYPIPDSGTNYYFCKGNQCNEVVHSICELGNFTNK
ncbi:thioredoxin domain-containing protein [bacterium 210820-DFI.6.37]|nr:thioredoxin domain-containing protein [bacterium 210820-DFI.6.37]